MALSQYYFIKAYNVSSSFGYPHHLFMINGWYLDRWWVGNDQEQAMLLEKYNCDAAMRESLLPYTLGFATTGGAVTNYSMVADNGYVSVYRPTVLF